PGATDRRVRNVAITRDLVAGIDDHDAAQQVVGQHAGKLAKHGRLSHARAAEQEDAFARLNEVLDDADRAVHGATDAAGEAYDVTGPVAYRGDAVKGALDTGTVVIAEL